ncbi:uncharacterized protein MONBRDRAFT_23637 [Monosiga brevicollis MX1]|uniref:GCF C-terminal domain-containing protein n=1 Tax=Monosiga brevicollis TaxID=81824 RepID=A9UU13_MONBE|nr:uncharacterized protein MONBRDRAFT_23637 [Monosiga brevicollis MX1]EDQ91588.1 predicted protein [Monosiga brevicollis MX1]|eukprot:XP_001744010.1 hypothetical protein [Monosiga brevicollis MX1]
MAPTDEGDVAPVPVMMKKKKRNKKPGDDAGSRSKVSYFNFSFPHGPNRARTTSMLTFADEETADDTPTFVVKKTRESRKFAKRSKLRVPQSTNLDDVAPGAAGGPSLGTAFQSSGSYSSAALSELRQQQQRPPENLSTLPDEELEPAAEVAPTAPVPSTTAIPTSEDISRARERRRAAREQQDFIPLDDNQPPSKQSSAARSRLLEENDDLDDDQDLVSQNLSFDQAARRDNRDDRRRQIADSMATTSSDPEDLPMPEATRGWDRRQQAAGVRKTVVYTNGTAHLATSDQQEGPETVRPQVDVAARLRDLRLTQERMHEVHQGHLLHARRIDHDIQALEERLPHEKTEAEAVAARFNFFQEMRFFLRDLLACLDAHVRWSRREKLPALSSTLPTPLNYYSLIRLLMHLVPAIQDLESQVHAACKEQADMLSERRRQDLAAWQARLTHWRLRRPEVFAAAGDAGSLPLDDELTPAQLNKYQTARRSLLLQGESVMSDVVDDFASIPAIGGQFETWKHRYPAAYRDAFVSESVVKIFQPFVTLKLLEWFPIDPSAPPVHTMPWMQDVLAFGALPDGQPPPAGDPDENVVPKVVEAVVLPKLAGFIEFVYDIFSQEQTSTLVATCAGVVHDFEIGEGSATRQQLHAAAVARLRRAVQEFVGVSIFPPEAYARCPEATALQAYQNGLCLKIMQNMLAWAPVVSLSDLQRCVAEQLLANRVHGALGHAVDVVAACGFFVHLLRCIPTTWWAAPSPSMALLRQRVADTMQTLHRVGQAQPASQARCTELRQELAQFQS